MKKFLFPILVLIVIGIGLLHFFTPGYLVFHHDTYRRLSYFPIVLGAIWFGWRGGLFLAVLSSIAFIPHLLLFIGKSPETYLSELTEVVLYLAAGTVTGIIAGKEAKLREQYRQLSEKLEKSYVRLHEQTELLLDVEEQLSSSQKFSALGKLSASLAHEIKNPLSSIKGTAEIFLDEFPEGHPKREFVEILLKEVARLNNTVNDVLQFSRGKKGVRGHREPLSVVLARVKTLLDSQLNKKNIAFALIHLEAGETFLVEGDKMSQVFLNIIINAIDAVPLKGDIKVELYPLDRGINISICDNGPGIANDEKGKIFEPFYSAKDEGTGLGLPISKKIVESYGGSVSVMDAPGGGTCFIVWLPSEDDNAAHSMI